MAMGFLAFLAATLDATINSFRTTWSLSPFAQSFYEQKWPFDPSSSSKKNDNRDLILGSTGDIQYVASEKVSKLAL